jgi:hypothetical protein
MTPKKLRDVLQRVEAWPEAAQAELAELALEIDAALSAGKYHATPEELAGIDRGLKAAREGPVCGGRADRGAFQKASACMKVVYTDDASEDLNRFLAYIASNYPAVYEAFLIRLRSVIARILAASPTPPIASEGICSGHTKSAIAVPPASTTRSLIHPIRRACSTRSSRLYPKSFERFARTASALNTTALRSGASAAESVVFPGAWKSHNQYLARHASFPI